MPSSLLAAAQRHAATVGLNLFGVVDAARFDASQPKDQRLASRWPRCGTVVLLGTGGKDFWQHFAAACAQAAATKTLPVPQQFAGQCVREIAAQFAARRLPVQVVEPDRCCASFGRLAEAAGFGTVSPVTGQILHPVFGPWVTLRAALLFEGQPFGAIPDGSITDGFQPCCSCRQPCLQPCPGAGTAQDCRAAAGCGPGPAGGVGSTCRCSCPIGKEHRHGPALEGPPGSGPAGSGSAAGPVRWLRIRVLSFVPWLRRR